MELERGFEPGSAGYKATTLPFELSSIDNLHTEPVNTTSRWLGIFGLASFVRQPHSKKSWETLITTQDNKSLNHDIKAFYFG